MRTRKSVGWTALGVLILCAACGSADENQAEVDPRSFAPGGLSADDLDAHLQVQVDMIADCMRERGYQFEPSTAEILNGDLLTGLGPIGVYVAQLEEPDRFVQGVREGAGAPGEQLAYRECDAEQSVILGERTASVTNTAARLEARWTAFEASGAYQDALEEFAECTVRSGYDFDSPDAANEYLGDHLQGEFAVLSTLSIDEQLAHLRPLVAEEDVVREVVTGCWNDHLQGPLSVYDAQVREEFADEIAQIRAAYLGEE